MTKPPRTNRRRSDEVIHRRSTRPRPSAGRGAKGVESVSFSSARRSDASSSSSAQRRGTRVHLRRGDDGALVTRRRAITVVSVALVFFAVINVSCALLTHPEDPVATMMAQAQAETDAPVEGASDGVAFDADDDRGTQRPDGQGWASALASAYSLETNDDWDQTATGIPLDNTSYTVAVPIGEEHLFRSTVELFYGGVSLKAKVTDSGNLATYGRFFDLSPAVWRAFGARSEDAWGVRDVYYRFV